ncbi:MAG: hypothetical protein ACOH1T_07385 [Microbacteriaceae bacterium]
MLRHNAVTPQEKVASLIALGACALLTVSALAGGSGTAFGASTAACLTNPPLDTIVTELPDPAFTPETHGAFGFRTEERTMIGSSFSTFGLHDAEPVSATSSTDTRFGYLRDNDNDTATDSDNPIQWITVNGEHLVAETNGLSVQLKINLQLQKNLQLQSSLSTQPAASPELHDGPVCGAYTIAP